MLGDKLKLSRIEKGYTQSAVASIIGISNSTMGMYEQGRRDPDTKTLLKLAKLYDVSIDYLLDNEITAQQKKTITIPILQDPQDAFFSENPQEVVVYMKIDEIDTLPEEFFALQIKENSMAPLMMVNDIVIVHRQKDVESGDLVAVFIHGDKAIVRSFANHAEGISLVAQNPQYAPQFYTKKEIQELSITILGKIVELRRHF